MSDASASGSDDWTLGMDRRDQGYSVRSSSARRPASDVAPCDDQTGCPTGRPSTGWRPERIGVHAGTRKQPRDQRIGVPHVAGVQLVSAPHGGRNGRHQIEDLLRSSVIVRDADGARNRLVRVRDGASAPSADLIAEQPEASSSFRPDRTFGHDASPRSSLVPDRRRLDDEVAFGYDHLEGGVVQGTPRAMFDGCFDRLVDLSIQADKVSACAQRDPEEVDSSGRGRGRHAGHLPVRPV